MAVPRWRRAPKPGSDVAQIVAPGLSARTCRNPIQKVNGGDTADWTQQAVFGSTFTGETLTLSQTELNLLTALGWTPTLPQDVFTASSGNWQTFADWDNGSMPITPEDAFIGVLTDSRATSNANVTVNSIGTNLYSSLTIGNDSTFTATNGTVLNPADTTTWASGNIGNVNVDGGSTLVIGNAFDNEGALTIGVNSGSGGNGKLKINGSVKLNGSGTLNLGQYTAGEVDCAIAADQHSAGIKAQS
jgi:hypothetical protein